MKLDDYSSERFEVPQNPTLFVDEWKLGETLYDGDEYVDVGDKGSQYLVKNDFRVTERIPVNIEITGRTVQLKEGLSVVQVKVEFVRDSEESDFGSGYIQVKYA